MSEKEKNGRIKGWKKRLKFIFDRLDGGLRVADYREEEVIPHSSLYDYLEFLRDAGIAILDEKDGRWYYAWKKEKEKLLEDYQVLPDDIVRQKKEYHFKNLVKDAIDEKGYNIRRFMNSDNFRYFLQHLGIGYREAHDVWENVEIDNTNIKNAFLELYKEVEKIASEIGYEVQEFSNLWQEIKERNLVFGRKISDLTELLITEESEIIGTYDAYEGKYINTHISVYPRILKTRDGSELYGNWEAKPGEFIEACDGSATIRSLYNEFLDIYANAEENYAKFLSEAESIIKSVVEDDHVPRGRCERCPKILSGRSS